VTIAGNVSVTDISIHQARVCKVFQTQGQSRIMDHQSLPFRPGDWGYPENKLAPLETCSDIDPNLDVPLIVHVKLSLCKLFPSPSLVTVMIT
jgi:hypothetical protein